MPMNTTLLKGFSIRATDGEIGTVEQFYFDDEVGASATSLSTPAAGSAAGGC